MGSIWRNRDFRRYMTVSLLICIPLAVLCFWLSITAGVAATVMLLLLLSVSCRYTKNRHRQIAELSRQLARAAGGDYRMDLDHYSEGELSILSSDIQKITGALAHQAEDLQRDQAFLADTLADISHQLKTPLTSMSMLADLLETPDLPEEKQREFLRGIRTSLDRLQWLVASLLKLSRLDAGAVAFQLEEVALEQVIRRAVQPLRVAAGSKGLSIEVEADTALYLETDRHWLAEAVGNLVKNCVEHTQQGGSITVRCEQNPLYTEIRIADNGPGIAAEDLPRIFERFYRGKNASPDSVGIGLALCRSTVQNLGGAISAENRAGGGALFVVKLYGKTVV